MFHIMRNKILSETSLLKTAREALERRLPPDWLLCPRGLEQRQFLANARADTVLELKNPEGTSALVMVEVKRKPVEAREVSFLVEAWRRALLAQGQGPAGGETPVNLMVVAPLLRTVDKGKAGPGRNKLCGFDREPSLCSKTPGRLYRNPRGEQEPLERENVPLRSPKGRGAGRVVRAFLDCRPPFGIRELAGATKSSAASVSRVADLLTGFGTVYVAKLLLSMENQEKRLDLSHVNLMLRYR